MMEDPKKDAGDAPSTANSNSSPPAKDAIPDRTKPPKAKKEKAPKPKKDPTKANTAPKTKAKGGNTPQNLPIDPEAMFKVGFLAEVYKEREKYSGGEAERVITRCKPTPGKESLCLIFALHSPSRTQRLSTYRP